MIDVNELSDEEFLKALEAAEFSNGSDDEIDDENVNGDVDTEDTEDSDDSDEDTDQETSESEDIVNEDETTETDDGESADTSGDTTETEDEVAEVNAQMEDGDTGTETEEANDGEVLDVDVVDYKKQYEELAVKNATLQQFHDEVTSEFTANGRQVKGFTDPKKIIQSQQMAYGYSEKMAAFKQYRPLMGPIKDRGMLDDPAKFNLMMDLYDGNPEALKAHIKKLNIDPLELDMETISYSGGNHLTSPIEIALNDVMENASKSGVRNEVEQVVREKWDPSSVVALLEDPIASSDIVEHISTGVFEAVQDRITEKKLTDIYGVFTNKPSITQYREALEELNREYTTQQQTVQQNEIAKKAEAVNAEKAKLEAERKAREYKAKAEQAKATADAARKNATSLSKSTPKAKVVKTTTDPMDLSDDDFRALVDGFVVS